MQHRCQPLRNVGNGETQWHDRGASGLVESSAVDTRQNSTSARSSTLGHDPFSNDALAYGALDDDGSTHAHVARVAGAEPGRAAVGHLAYTFDQQHGGKTGTSAHTWVKPPHSRWNAR